MSTEYDTDGLIFEYDRIRIKGTKSDFLSTRPTKGWFTSNALPITRLGQHRHSHGWPKLSRFGTGWGQAHNIIILWIIWRWMSQISWTLPICIFNLLALHLTPLLYSLKFSINHFVNSLNCNIRLNVISLTILATQAWCFLKKFLSFVHRSRNTKSKW